jgi:hypothetical protein
VCPQRGGCAAVGSSRGALPSPATEPIEEIPTLPGGTVVEVEATQWSPSCNCEQKTAQQPRGARVCAGAPIGVYRGANRRTTEGRPLQRKAQPWLVACPLDVNPSYPPCIRSSSQSYRRIVKLASQFRQAPRARGHKEALHIGIDPLRSKTPRGEGDRNATDIRRMHRGADRGLSHTGRRPGLQ